MHPQDLLTPREAADLLRWSLPTIYTYAARRKLPTIKLGRSLRFRRSDLEKLIKAGERPALRPYLPRDAEGEAR